MQNQKMQNNRMQNHKLQTQEYRTTKSRTKKCRTTKSRAKKCRTQKCRTKKNITTKCWATNCRIKNAEPQKAEAINVEPKNAEPKHADQPNADPQGGYGESLMYYESCNVGMVWSENADSSLTPSLAWSMWDVERRCMFSSHERTSSRLKRRFDRSVGVQSVRQRYSSTSQQGHSAKRHWSRPWDKRTGYHTIVRSMSNKTL